MQLDLLRACFPPESIEWRIGQCGTKADKKVWAKCLAYISNRAVMERLDNVCGPENWRNEFAKGPEGGVLCGISIRVTLGDSSEWVTKWDGAGNTDIESVKGGLSDSMKRAAVQWGIGRYLYDLEEGWAIVSENGDHYGRTKDGVNFHWDPPELPAWALPSGTAKPSKAPAVEGDSLGTVDAKYIEDCAAEIRQAPTIEALTAIGLILKEKPESIQNALRSLYKTRLRVLKSQPETAS